MITSDRYGRIHLRSQIGNRGGEGTVYEVDGLPNFVAKIYHQQPSAQRIDKLRCLTQFTSPELRKVSAWPESILFEDGQPVGFVMPKIEAKPIHFLYRPVDRKDHFPSVSWKDLLNTCRNLCAGFHALHSKDILMGDVNETNVLVTEHGETRFIDCDSYQLRSSDGKIYLCEVGSSLWTPPELQGKSFNNIQRTEQHDLFGLAVLIFHILFMGRHPFAGVPSTRAGLDNPPTIEDCIRAGNFAFSRRAVGNLGTPPYSLTLGALPDNVAVLFEQAFLTPSRPSAAIWFRELKTVEFQKCQWGHHYVRRLNKCPWCDIWNSGGPNFFVVAAVVNSTLSGVAEVERLAIEIEQSRPPDFDDATAVIKSFRFGGWQPPPPIGIGAQSQIGSPIQISQTRWVYYLGWALTAGATIGLFAAGQVFILWIFVGILGFGMISGGRVNPKYRDELVRRREAVPIATARVESKQREYAAVEKKWDALFSNQLSTFCRELVEHRRATLAEFAKKRHSIEIELKAAIGEYRELGNRELALLNKRRESAQLEDYLRRHRISSTQIPQIGPARSALLSQYGIETAWDVKHMRYIPRLGHGAGNLRIWLGRLEAQFVFNPRAPVSDLTKQEVRRDILNSTRQLTEKFAALQQEWFSLLRDFDLARLTAIRDSRVSGFKLILSSINERASADKDRLIKELGESRNALAKALSDEKLCP
jgi:DNA-binding helix-hairpin-helix protein with protein kinase domain